MLFLLNARHTVLQSVLHPMKLSRHQFSQERTHVMRSSGCDHRLDSREKKFTFASLLLATSDATRLFCKADKHDIDLDIDCKGLLASLASSWLCRLAVSRLTVGHPVTTIASSIGGTGCSTLQEMLLTRSDKQQMIGAACKKCRSYSKQVDR